MTKTTKDELTLIKKTTVRLPAKNIQEIKEMLKEHKRVRVLELGTFIVRHIKSKKMFNSMLGEKITVKARKRVVFVAFDSLAKKFNPTPRVCPPKK